MLKKIMTVALAILMCLSLLAACGSEAAPTEPVEQEQQTQPADVTEPEADPTEDETEPETETAEPETQVTEPQTETVEPETTPATEPEVEEEEFEEEEEDEEVPPPPPGIGGNLTVVA